jgi:hypothetical protein
MTSWVRRGYLDLPEVLAAEVFDLQQVFGRPDLGLVDRGLFLRPELVLRGLVGGEGGLEQRLLAHVQRLELEGAVADVADHVGLLLPHLLVLSLLEVARSAAPTSWRSL